MAGSDSVSPADSISGDGGGSLGSNDAANTGITNGGEAKAGVVVANGGVGDQAFAPFVEDVVDRFVVDGGSNGTAKSAHMLRNCSMFNRSTVGHVSTTFSTRSSTTQSGSTPVRGGWFRRRAPHARIPSQRLLHPSAKVPATARHSDAWDRHLHGEFVSSMLDGQMPDQGEGARFGYLVPGSVIVGVDAVDLPEGCAARVDPLRAMDDLLFGKRSRGGRLAAMAREAAARGGCVAASVAGHIYRARVDPNTGFPALFPVPAPRAALEPGALRDGSYAIAHLTDATPGRNGRSGRAGANSLVRLELDGDVLGSGTSRFGAGSRALPPDHVRTVRRECKHHRRGGLRGAAQEGFVALEGCAFLETYVARGELRGLPCGFP